MVWWGYMLLGGILALIISFAQGQVLALFPTISMLVLAPLLFALAKIMGNFLIYLFWYQQWWTFFRHFLRETLSFVLVGVVAGGVMEFLVPLVGGNQVMPAQPAVLTYVLYIFLTYREKHGRY